MHTCFIQYLLLHIFLSHALQGLPLNEEISNLLHWGGIENGRTMHSTFGHGGREPLSSQIFVGHPKHGGPSTSVITFSLLHFGGMNTAGQRTKGQKGSPMHMLKSHSLHGPNSSNLLPDGKAHPSGICSLHTRSLHILDGRPCPVKK